MRSNYNTAMHQPTQPPEDRKPPLPQHPKTPSFLQLGIFKRTNNMIPPKTNNISPRRLSFLTRHPHSLLATLRRTLLMSFPAEKNNINQHLPSPFITLNPPPATLHRTLLPPFPAEKKRSQTKTILPRAVAPLIVIRAAVALQHC